MGTQINVEFLSGFSVLFQIIKSLTRHHTLSLKANVIHSGWKHALYRNSEGMETVVWTWYALFHTNIRHFLENSPRLSYRKSYSHNIGSECIVRAVPFKCNQRRSDGFTRPPSYAWCWYNARTSSIWSLTFFIGKTISSIAQLLKFWAAQAFGKLGYSLKQIQKYKIRRGKWRLENRPRARPSGRNPHL